MLFMMIVKASKHSEGEVERLPSTELREAMDKYNEDLVNAGVRVMAKGLYPSSEALRISYPTPGGEPVVTNGPFSNTNELIAGFFLIDVESKEEAIKWAMKCPDPMGHGEGQIELRQVR